MNDKDQADEFEDDYIVEFVPTSSFEYERHEQKHIMKIIKKSLIRNVKQIHSIIRKCPEQKEIDEITHQHLPEDKRFVRYFKRRIKYLVKREYYEIVDTEQYLGNISLIFAIINDLSKNGIFLFGRNLLVSNDELLPFLTEMICIILSKNLDELEDIEREYIFKASIRIALLNIELNKEKATKLNDKIMNELDYAFELFNALNTKVMPVLIGYYQDETEAIPIIQNFEFVIKRKSWKCISKLISGQYGGAALEIAGDTLIFKQVDKSHFPTTSSDKLIKETIKKFKSCSERNIVEPIKYFRFEKVESESDKDNFIIATIVKIKNIKPKKMYFRKNGKYDSDWIILEC